MAVRYWHGDVDGDPTNLNNWSGDTLPNNGDTVIFNDQALVACDGADLSTADAGIKLAVIVEESFPHTVGSSGTAFKPAGYTLLHYAGSGVGTSYFGIGANGPLDCDDVYVNTKSQLASSVEVAGTILRWTQHSGKATIDSGATISGRISVMGGGTVPSELTVPSGVTTTGMILAIDGGKVSVSADVERIDLNAGECVLAGTASITGGEATLEQYGGTFFWDAQTSSTIGLAEIRGGIFRTRTARIGRTMTQMRTYGDANVDFSIGGGAITFTNGIQVNGTNPPKMPKGMKYSFTFQSD